MKFSTAFLSGINCTDLFLDRIIAGVNDSTPEHTCLSVPMSSKDGKRRLNYSTATEICVVS